MAFGEPEGPGSRRDALAEGRTEGREDAPTIQLVRFTSEDQELMRQADELRYAFVHEQKQWRPENGSRSDMDRYDDLKGVVHVGITEGNRLLGYVRFLTEPPFMLFEEAGFRSMISEEKIEMLEKEFDNKRPIEASRMVIDTTLPRIKQFETLQRLFSIMTLVCYEQGATHLIAITMQGIKKFLDKRGLKADLIGEIPVELETILKTIKLEYLLVEETPQAVVLVVDIEGGKQKGLGGTGRV